jgi:YidC/Oxa1 family membrane protein insertase
VNPLNALYTAVAWVLRQIYDPLSHLFGSASGLTWVLSIVILVVLMRLVMVPLFIKQMHTTRKMSALAPQMQALRKKYKNDRQTLNQETMRLYQEAGVNPLMGCLPVVAQLPVWFALFSVLRAIAEWKPGQATKYGLPEPMVQSAHQAAIFGAHISDKVLFTGTLQVPVEAKVVILIAVLISMVTTFLTVRQSQKRGMMPATTPDNPMGQSQKYMMYIMPFFALSGLYWPFGLVLYWVTTNLWTLGQQAILLRVYPQPTMAAAGGEASGTAAGSSAVGGSARALRRGGQGKALPGGQVGPGKPASGGGGSGPGRDARNAGDGKTSRSDGSAAGRRAGAAANGARASADGAANGSGGLLRKLGRAKEAPAAAPAGPEVKLVRQQRQKQSRSKRSGKR